ncbi:MAG TPA: OsmC family protein [Nannocystaceae bacterium]|nr:OsmC family protein [Nannocystaceae bacterium]
MQRTAKAVWDGDLKSGSGHLTTGSNTLSSTKYTFASRFEDGRETNPEELIAAAHAGCFTMAITAELARQGITPKQLTTNATVTLERVDNKPTITGIALALKAEVPGADKAIVTAAVEGAKAGCVISRLVNAPITLVHEIIV